MADIRRTPYKEKHVKDLSVADFKVTITGAVAGLREDGFLLGDGSGEVFINTSRMETIDVYKENEIVKVFGRLMPYESGFEIQAEIIQALAGVDMAALKTIKDALL
jgi:hypothetical protein